MDILEAIIGTTVDLSVADDSNNYCWSFYCFSSFFQSCMYIIFILSYLSGLQLLLDVWVLFLNNRSRK